MLDSTLKSHIYQNTNIDIKGYTALSGGSINNAAKVETQRGTCVLKWNAASLFPMFEAEEKGLELLKENTVQFIIPEVFGSGKNGEYSWLLMNYIHEVRAGDACFTRFGESLAELHTKTQPDFGLDHDNFIGRLPQSNQKHNSWPEFFERERIRPQLERAIESGKIPKTYIKQAERLFHQLASIFPDEPACLLHGDLWSGNFISTDKNQTALIDPAVYFGNREMELAFTKLFGGFGTAFYEAYHHHYPLQPGFEHRTEICNLYPLLVHVNLFGGGYISQVTSILKRF